MYIDQLNLLNKYKDYCSSINEELKLSLQFLDKLENEVNYFFEQNPLVFLCQNHMPRMFELLFLVLVYLICYNTV